MKGFDLPDYRLVINNRKILEAKVAASREFPSREKKGRLPWCAHKDAQDGRKDRRDGGVRQYGLTGKAVRRGLLSTVVVGESIDDAAARVPADRQRKGVKGVAERRKFLAKHKIGLRRKA